MIKRLAHVCFFSDQPLELVAFYQKAFGFPIAFEMNSDEGSPIGWYLDCGDDTFIEIFDQSGAVKKWGGEVVAMKQGGPTFYRHFCLEVTDLEALRASLLEKDISATDIIMGIDNSYQCWIKDPDGNDVELMQYTENSLQFSRR
ncbi:VOC family protein [Pelagicoccus albus]|uniref:VOC family protein n=1 Tax=Pelagicoccus albus TaxID=415222 RepID=A0A7X1B8C4_9BACT|nr:VOC family protein [Pelagicoccus albus]MBC2607441.1 VOC family protein [Pelagicoccus albus]